MPFSEAKRVPGKVLYVDMIGLSVVDDATGETLGTLQEVLAASQDILEIRTPDGREVLLPWVDQFVKSVDLEAGQVRVTPIEGFFDCFMSSRGRTGASAPRWGPREGQGRPPGPTSNLRFGPPQGGHERLPCTSIS